jgi:type VI protein secretion system component VasF
MMRTDYYNEALITAMLVAASAAPAPAAAGADCAGAPAGGGQESPVPLEADPLREYLGALLAKGHRDAIQRGFSRENAAAADFAVAAFIDEILLSSPVWPGRTEWMRKPLQFVRHDTATAGEDFYLALDSLLAKAEAKASPLPAALGGADGPPQPKQTIAKAGENPEEPAHPGRLTDEGLEATLEIFALCLAQGFTGMLYDDVPALNAKLDSLGRFVPELAARRAPPLLAPIGKSGRPKRARNALSRFDLLDAFLWITPVVLTALLYLLCQSRLDAALRPFLQGGASL